MGRRSKHLSSKERGVIFAEHERGNSQQGIGRLLGRPASTICRELARGRQGDGSYCPAAARRVYDARRTRCRRRRRLSPPEPHRNQDALCDVAGPTTGHAGLRPSGRRAPGPRCRPERLHRTRHTRNSSRGMTLSGERGGPPVTRFVHVWMPPLVQVVSERLKRVIGCGHVSGLSLRR